MKLKMLFWIIWYKLDSKLDAIINENGGPKTTQHRKAIMQSVKISKINLFLRVRFFKLFLIVLERIYKPYLMSMYCILSIVYNKDNYVLFLSIELSISKLL